MYVSKKPNLRLYGFYVDVGSGRDAESRRELKRLKEDCMNGHVELIVTKSVSRFGRNTLDTLNICRQLKNIGVGVYFLLNEINSLSSEGELRLSLTSAVAEFESYSKSENIKWGLNKSAQNGESKLYNRVCYGYKKDENGKLIIDEENAAVVRRVFDLYLEGYGISRIKQALEKDGIVSPTGGVEWPKRTIEKMLRNEKYCGRVILNKTYTSDYPEKKTRKNWGERVRYLCEEHHEALISVEVFEKTQEMINSRAHKTDK